MQQPGGTAMSGIFWAGRTLLVCVTLTTSAICGAAHADAPNNAELFALVKDLQSRVATLESQSENYRNQAEAAQAALAKIAALSEPTDSTVQPFRLAPPTADHSTPKSTPVAFATDEFPVPQWSGFYWGTSRRT